MVNHLRECVRLREGENTPGVRWQSRKEVQPLSYPQAGIWPGPLPTLPSLLPGQPCKVPERDPLDPWQCARNCAQTRRT